MLTALIESLWLVEEMGLLLDLIVGVLLRCVVGEVFECIVLVLGMLDAFVWWCWTYV